MGLRTQSTAANADPHGAEKRHGTENPQFTAAGAKKMTLVIHRAGCSQALIAAALRTEERAWD